MRTVTDEEFANALQAMRAAGAKDGKAAGGWIADGNTSEAALREMLQQWDDGDPAAPESPMAFSGEWAGDPTVDDVVASETELRVRSLEPEELSELASAYEDAYTEAWYDEAQRTVRGLLPE